MLKRLASTVMQRSLVMTENPVDQIGRCISLMFIYEIVKSVEEFGHEKA